ncbi:hypothetical protein LZ554_009105 [Drepanopeziza brunnea f. sp. 'monogermtubi']|nr:hypothetical protein LZ554_009105 [Drepanopeziza brunnea f. sp. 'monogermtubi']
MRSAVILAAFSATLAVASPVHFGLHKKAVVTNYEVAIEYVTVTVTAPHPGYQTPKPSPTPLPVYKPKPAPKPDYKPTPIPVFKPLPVYVPEPVPEPEPVPAYVPTPAPEPEPVPAPVSYPETKIEDTKPTDYKSTALYHHNKHRANHSAEALLWDDTLASYAKTIAYNCVFEHDMNQGGGGYGQNLAAYGTTADMSTLDPAKVAADAITNQWYYGETANMPWGQDSPATEGVPEYLHLTAILWKSTTHVGCYTATCGAGTIFSYASMYTVCNYKEPGNMLGSFTKEVTKPIGLPSIEASIK